MVRCHAGDWHLLSQEVPVETERERCSVHRGHGPPDFADRLEVGYGGHGKNEGSLQIVKWATVTFIEMKKINELVFGD